MGTDTGIKINTALPGEGERGSDVKKMHHF